jgi:hypothetical protein
LAQAQDVDRYDSSNCFWRQELATNVTKLYYVHIESGD